MDHTVGSDFIFVIYCFIVELFIVFQYNEIDELEIVG